MRSDGCTWAPCFIIVCLHTVQQWPWISPGGVAMVAMETNNKQQRCTQMWRETDSLRVTFSTVLQTEHDFGYMFFLLPPHPASKPSTFSAEASHSGWPSDPRLTPQCLFLFLGLPVKYPLSQGSSSGCSLPCCFSHYWLASHSLFLFFFFLLLCRDCLWIFAVSTNQSNLLTKTSEKPKAQFAPSS